MYNAFTYIKIIYCIAQRLLTSDMPCLCIYFYIPLAPTTHIDKTYFATEKYWFNLGLSKH